MDDSEDIRKVIDAFFANASPEDLRELEEYISKLNTMSGAPGTGPGISPGKSGKFSDSKKGFESLNPDKMAKKFSATLQERMGLTTESIRRTARDAVRTMILQYDPFTPEEQIDALLDKFVPDKENQWKRIPGDTMRAMISQYAAYGKGELTEAHLKTFPEGWAKKYWSNFPPKIQLLIKGYIEDKISEKDFWNFVDSILMDKK